MINKLLVLILIYTLATFTVEAKMLYVNQSIGNDSVTYEANSSSNPWRTIGRAVWGSTNQNSTNASQAASAGDTVLVGSGTYSVQRTKPSGGQIGTYYGPNFGSAGNYIVFQAVGTVILQQTGNAGAVWQPRNYTIIDGFTFDSANITKVYSNGAVSLYQSDNAIIRNCVFNGDSWGLGGDNHCGLWASIATNATVSNNRFNGYKDLGGSDENAAGITVYGCSNLIVENNEFYNNVTGIYLKGTTGGIRITGLLLRKNLFYNNAGAGIFTVAVGDPYSTLPVNKIYQNIIWGSGYFGIRANQWTRNTYFINNTVAGSLGMFLASNPEEGAFFSVYVHNNISHSNTVGFSLGTVTNASLLNINNNLISNYSVYGSFSGVNYDDISFKSATGYQSNSSTRNPLFLNYAERDFRLQAGSPALTLGVDILNLTDGGTSARIPAGAYITGNEVIGIGQLDSPSAPRSLRILN